MSTNGNNSVNQFGNAVDGDMAGRDIIKNYYAGTRTLMSYLIEKFHKEKETNVAFSDIVDELQHFKDVVSPAGLIGLEAKLAAGSRQDEIDTGLRLKHQCAKKLMKYELFESSQLIYAYLLGEVLTRFRKYVTPLILANEDRAKIDSVTFEKVVQPIVALLEENVLNINSQEIEGMMFFLSGNCHIRWDNANISSSI